MYQPTGVSIAFGVGVGGEAGSTSSLIAIIFILILFIDFAAILTFTLNLLRKCEADLTAKSYK